jgi:isopenicillin N synthase-like dioxygenase
MQASPTATAKARIEELIDTFEEPPIIDFEAYFYKTP